MNKLMFIAGSFPKIVTSGKTRRKNEEGINDDNIREYIKLLGQLLLVKKELKDIKFTYIGGYEGIENTNTAKLYFSAFSYFFKELQIGELSKSNFTIITENDYLNASSEVINTLENTDFLFLGLGSDAIFGRLLDLFYEDGISIKDIIKRNNTLVASICAGTVVTSKNIYGGKYDSFYHEREEFTYPKSYPALDINECTMETNLYPESQTEEKNQEFKDKCLLPDSYQKAFYGCRQNSYIIMNNGVITAVGEIYLFIDGEILEVTLSNDKKDITRLNELVNAYNETKDKEVKDAILEELERIRENQSDLTFYIDEFKKQEEEKRERKDNLKEYLEMSLYQDLDNILNCTNTELIKKERLNPKFLNALNLNSDNDEELIMKYNLVALIKKYALLYGYNYRLYLSHLYEIFKNYINVNPVIVLYFIECFSALYSNQDMKKLLTLTKLEIDRRVNGLSKNNVYFKRFWKLTT